MELGRDPAPSDLYALVVCRVPQGGLVLEWEPALGHARTHDTEEEPGMGTGLADVGFDSLRGARAPGLPRGPLPGARSRFVVGSGRRHAGHCERGRRRVACPLVFVDGQ